MIIGFSIQTNWRFYKNDNEWISFWRINKSKIGDFNAIEIVVDPKQEKNFKLSAKNYEWLSTLKYISYHLVEFSNYTENVIKQLPFVSNFICHYDWQKIYDNKFFEQHEDKLLIENIENQAGDFKKTDKICFDIAHVLNDGVEVIDEFYTKHKNKIKELHISNYNNKIKHIPIYNSGIDLNFDMLKEYPIILEGSFRDIQEMKKELNYIKGEIYEIGL